MALSDSQAASSQEPTTVEKLRGLPWSIFSNAANTIFAQFTFFGSVFVLFLSDLGMGKAQIGFLLSLLPFSGLVALFIAPAVARFGYKRTYITFFTLRKCITAGLLLTPWVLSRFGQEAMVLYVTLIVAGFALARAVAETGVYPWIQEYIPNSVRGKYSATNSIYTTLTGLLAVGVAGFTLGYFSGLTGYMVLMAAGVFFGLLSAWAATFIPGGAPDRSPGRQESLMRDMLATLRDANFLRYLLGAALITLGTVPMGSFLPLFMQEQVGLAASHIVLIQSGTLIGTLVFSLAWGWAADRYGSKPVMISGLALKLLLPVAWFLMPRHSPLSLPVALGIAVVVGISDIGWAIGAGRLLFVSVVPPDKKMAYMAVHYAWVGVVGGLSQLAGGWLLSLSANLRGQIAGFTLDPYTPLFALAFILLLGCLWLLLGMRADNVYGVGQFAGMFFRGNPFLAVNALVRYYAARDERAAISVTERLGQAKSPLAVDELLTALRDPRFNVRFEAIISIARMPPDDRLIQALIDVLNGTELALGGVAAWALGRMGDPRAIEPLHAALDSPYHSIRAHAARALGALHDTSAVPILLARLPVEQDKGLQMAYASALGNIRAREALEPILKLMYATQNEGARLELALSVARITGDEHAFVQLVRQMREDPGTTAAQALAAFRRRLQRLRTGQEEELAALEAVEGAFARGQLQEGVQHLAALLHRLPPTWFEDAGGQILAECARRLAEFGESRQEYLLLALHLLPLSLTPS